MCGRFTLTVDASVLAGVFEIEPPSGFLPRYNIAPTQKVPILRRVEGSQRSWGEVRWGLVPPWAKDIRWGARMINARGETVAKKPAFRSAVKRRRCLVPADGFFEWQKTPAGKQPHYIRFADGRPFALAGLWERWNKGEQPLDTFTIITTSPNDVVAALHDRMPVILPPEHYDEWLDPGPMEESRLEALLRPHPAAGMESYPVSTHVNSPQNDDPQCVLPVNHDRA
jgi:putative SOS response-associated peptidase YedK